MAKRGLGKLLAKADTGAVTLDEVRVDHPRGGTPLVSQASFTAERGEVVLIVGAAGAGTSRLMAAILGKARFSGRIHVLGRDVARLRKSSLRKLRCNIGIVPQDLVLLERLSAHRNVELPLEIDGVPRSISVVRAMEIMVRLGLDGVASVPVDVLSNSERQRVAVARALVREPELVLADHPTSLQDAAGAELVCDALTAAANVGACIVSFAHDSTIRRYAERCGWRQMALVYGRIDPIALSGFDETALDDSLRELEGLPGFEPSDGAIQNVISFPQSSRTTGIA